MDDVVALEHGYGCGVAIDAPGRHHPHPHPAQPQPEPQLWRRGDGGEPGLRKAAARAFAAPGSIPVVDERSSTQGLDVVCLQDEAHVGFMSMVESILRRLRRTCSA